jgi:hypothetical protein
VLIGRTQRAELDSAASSTEKNYRCSSRPSASEEGLMDWSCLSVYPRDSTPWLGNNGIQVPPLCNNGMKLPLLNSIVSQKMGPWIKEQKRSKVIVRGLSCAAMIWAHIRARMT